jgi:hypothetical protein
LCPLVIVSRAELSSISIDTDPPLVEEEEEEEEESWTAFLIAIETNFDKCQRRSVPSACPERRYSRQVLIAEQVMDELEEETLRGV